MAIHLIYLPLIRVYKDKKPRIRCSLLAREGSCSLVLLSDAKHQTQSPQKKLLYVLEPKRKEWEESRCLLTGRLRMARWVESPCESAECASPGPHNDCGFFHSAYVFDFVS